jgi:hypothetical protein
LLIYFLLFSVVVSLYELRNLLFFLFTSIFYIVSIRDWPWWRLLVRVNPLLNVHRAEEKLKIACSELQTLKLKLEKVENDRIFLKQENQNLEGKVRENFKILNFSVCLENCR